MSMGEGSKGSSPMPTSGSDLRDAGGRVAGGGEVGYPLAVEEGPVLVAKALEAARADSIGESDPQAPPRGHPAPVEVAKVSRMPGTAADQHGARPSSRPLMTSPDPVRAARRSVRVNGLQQICLVFATMGSCSSLTVATVLGERGGKSWENRSRLYDGRLR